MDVIEWLAAYYIKTHFFEKAIQYFERAKLRQPTQVKWQLMVASCYRRSGNYQKALETYKDIHRLRFLVRLCTDTGLKEVQEYATKLKKVEKMKEIREQRVKSGREGSGRDTDETDSQSEPKLLSPLLDSGRDSSCSSSSSTKGECLSTKMRSLPGLHEPYEASSPKELDASYMDPLGPQMERPKTGAKKRVEDDGFVDEELGDDLLPE
ncbi:intraflagellar transport protein 88 homolog [Cheilinus undulatus]|uniref:intraflagellar transport protein 88 homolog n=1 Tax=Cheilinus undulatus TaxID=241271 RepID=UPI001BD23884|nr:intraflagellar transport protein 88 homolog [Cheilinus undulatus]